MENYRNLDVNLSYTALINKIGISYLGNVSKSAKLEKSEKNGVLTYGVYLAPWNLSGYQVCAGGRHCHDFCLSGSGQNRADILARGIENSLTNISRIKKTRLFYENRPVFMKLLIHEINRAANKAADKGMPFAVRLNCTSDLSPELFVHDGRNILDIFPNIQFYDYTKVRGRLSLLGKYKNYDLTFSFDGYNMKTAKEFLQAGGRVAVVFDGHRLPAYFDGWQVIDGNSYDFRFKDPGRVIVGLNYHPVANDYKIVHGVRTYVTPVTPFVIRESDSRNVF